MGYKGNSRYVGLATDLGNEYYTHFGAEYQPVGMVNRHGLVNYTDWSGKVHDALQDTASVLFRLSATYDTLSRQASVIVNASSLDKSFTGHLQVWLVEDSITALQKMPDGSVDYNYLHNHVLRAAVNGDWGEEVSIPATESKRCSDIPTLCLRIMSPTTVISWLSSTTIPVSSRWLRSE